MADADGKIRMEKCGKTPEKVKRIKREMRMAKINKQTNKRKKSVSVAWLGPSCKVRVINSWHRLLRVFSQFFESCNSFH